MKWKKLTLKRKWVYSLLFRHFLIRSLALEEWGKQWSMHVLLDIPSDTHPTYKHVHWPVAAVLLSARWGGGGAACIHNSKWSPRIQSTITQHALTSLAPFLPMARSPMTSNSCKIQCSSPTEQCSLRLQQLGQYTVLTCCARVINISSPKPFCLLQFPLNKENGTLPGNYAALLT